MECGSELVWMELFNSKRDLADTIFKMPVYVEGLRKGDGHVMQIFEFHKKEMLLIVFELNPTCLRAEINGESISGFGLIYVIHGNAKDGDEVKIVNCHIKADCVVTLAQLKDRKARG